MNVRVVEIESRIAVTPNRQKGIENFDVDNAYPQRVRNYVNSSGRAKQCVNTFARFIRGGGFADSTFYKTRVNKTLTNDKLLRKVVDDYALHKGFAVGINYDALGRKVSLNHIPFEFVRLGIDVDTNKINSFKIYHDWSCEEHRRIKDDEVKKYDLYNPDPKVVFDNAMAAGGFQNWRGQIFYFSPDGLKYPLSTIDAVLEDVAADAEAKSFRLKNISTNFLASQILEVDAFETNDDEDDFMKMLESFQGGTKTSKILVVPKKKKEQTFKLSKVDIQDVDDLFEHTEQAIKESIRGVFMQPAVLLSDLISGKLGTAQEIDDATSYYNGVTTDDRLIFEETFTELFRGWHDPNVNPSNNYQIQKLSFTFNRPANAQPVATNIPG